ncbi:YtxH domain-containing protein [Flavobacterium enshiense]|uniref:YtxH domain-containing protein n=1 Tax=Flavobacterium enshiense TaxID=1341165 RepID=UPI00345D280E
MRPSNVVLGVLGGLAVGAALGVLFAPDKGSNTRKKIAQKGTDLKNNIKDGIHNIIASAEEKYNDFASRAKNSVDENMSNLERMNSEIDR